MAKACAFAAAACGCKLQMLARPAALALLTAMPRPQADGKASHESVYDLSLRCSQAAPTLIYAVSPCVVLESDSESLQGVRLTTWMMIMVRSELQPGADDHQ